MTQPEQVIADLESATRPSRKLDWAIGELLGWVLQVEEGVDPETGTPFRKENWVSPETGKFAKVPEYSSLLDRAVDLTKYLCGGAPYGVGMAQGKARASVGGDDSCYGATPAIALCIAALRYRVRRQSS
jgi:hypothetical protein